MSNAPKNRGQIRSLIDNASTGAKRGAANVAPSRRRIQRDRRHASSAGALAWMEQLEPRSMMSVNPVGAPPAPLLPAESIDGIGNNVAHPTWGSTGQDLLRLSPAAYGDGISTPSGADRPGARLVSNLLAASPEGGVTNDRDFTAFVYAWGQFLDHDLGLTDTATPR